MKATATKSENRTFTVNNTVKKPRLSPSMPMQAIESQARRAAAIARATKKDAEPTKKKTKKPLPQLSPIEKSMRSIRRAIGNMPSGSRSAVVFESPGAMSRIGAISTACDVIKIYYNGEAFNSALAARKTDSKVKMPLPDETYVFFPSHTDSARLGSVAVYSANVATLLASIRNSGSLFGQPVKSVSVEYGYRAFLDVKIG